MNNQEQNREALIEHIAEQDRIIRRRNQQIETQARNASETQRALEEIARERDEARSDARRASERWRKELTLRNEVADELRRLRATQPRPLTPDAITDEMVERARAAYQDAPVSQSLNDDIRDMLTAALTEPPARPEWMDDAEQIEPLLREIEGVGFVTDPVLLSRHLAERGVRVVTEGEN